MSRQASSAVIGLFVVVAVALGVAAPHPPRRRPPLSRAPTSFVVYFRGSVAGLLAGAPVKFKGVEVGRVRDVYVMLTNARTDVARRPHPGRDRARPDEDRAARAPAARLEELPRIEQLHRRRACARSSPPPASSPTCATSRSTSSRARPRSWSAIRRVPYRRDPDACRTPLENAEKQAGEVLARLAARRHRGDVPQRPARARRRRAPRQRRARSTRRCARSSAAPPPSRRRCATSNALAVVAAPPRRRGSGPTSSPSARTSAARPRPLPGHRRHRRAGGTGARSRRARRPGGVPPRAEPERGGRDRALAAAPRRQASIAIPASSSAEAIHEASLLLAGALLLGACSILPEPKSVRYRYMVLEATAMPDPAPRARLEVDRRAARRRAAELPRRRRRRDAHRRERDPLLARRALGRAAGDGGAARPRRSTSSSRLAGDDVELLPPGSLADTWVEVAIERFEPGDGGRPSSARAG